MKKSIIFITVLAVLILTDSNSNSETIIPSSIGAPPPLGLVAYYPFNGDADDESGHGNNGTVYGATLTEDKSGSPDSAYSFNGESDYIQVADSNTLDMSGNMSIAAWVCSTAPSNYQRVVAKGNNYELSMNSSDPHQWSFWVSGGPALYSLSNVEINTWIHLAATYDGSYMRIYINGIQDNLMAKTGPLNPDSTALVIGQGSGYYFDGKITQIMIYDRALSPEEIRQLAALTPPWINDYNGDGTSDIAIFRGNSGLWAVRGVTRVYFGSSTDETVPGDYDGDGTTDIGIFRPTSGLWAIRSVTRAYFGGGSDLPEPGDYDGDGTADIGIFRGLSGLWAIRDVTRVYFGATDDLPVPGDYDGDGTKEIGVFRGSSGLWAARGVSRLYFGGSSDSVVPGDYEGDGTWTAGIFRSSSGLWAIRGVTRSYFGSGSDLPVPADYTGSGADSIGIFRESSGLWAAKSVTRLYFGTTGDIPVTR